MAKNVASLAEVNRAKQFLKAIGAYPTNQMLLAVIAFLRVNKYDTKKEVRWAATTLIERSVFHRSDIHGDRGDAINDRNRVVAEQYKAILKAARESDVVQFLYSLVLSKWDADHFGGWLDGSIDPTKNRLFRMYDQFTGLILTPPEAPPMEVAKPPKLPPRDLPPPPAMREYIDPGAARRFYVEKHRHPVLLE